MFTFTIIAPSTLQQAAARAAIGFGGEAQLPAEAREDSQKAASYFVAWARRIAERTAPDLLPMMKALKPADVRQRMSTGDCVARVQIGECVLIVGPSDVIPAVPVSEVRDHRIIANAGAKRRREVTAASKVHVNALRAARREEVRQLTAG